MSQSSRELDRRLRRLRRPPLSPDLKHRVMSAAVLPAAAASWRDRAWFSPAWRLAAACALGALLLADHWSAGLTSPAVPDPGSAAARAEREVAELGKELGMPPELARRMAAQVDPPTLAAHPPSADEVGRLLR